VRVVSGDKVVSEGGKDATVGHVKGGVKGDCKGVCSDNADKVIEGAMVEATDKVDSVEGVRVGDVLVRVQKKNPNPKEFVSGKKGTSFEAGGYISNKRGQPSIQKLVCKYKSREGMMASVVNGESIPDVQNRIADAGFSDIVITSVGANIVLLRSSSNVLFHTRINDAKEFFDHFFTNLVRWEKEILSFQRGVWLRIYGVPIHAWNASFFKLCSLDCGRFLRTNACSVEKERFDYARVLVATSSYEIINCSEEILIDGVLVTVKIFEEWGFNIGEDACLFEEEDEVKEEPLEQEDVQVDHRMDANANILVEKLVNDLVVSKG